MHIVHHRPWPRQVARAQQISPLLERLLTNAASNAAAPQWVPSVDVREEAGRFVIFADLPGIAPEQIQIQMDKGVLSIKGERSAGIGAETETARYARTERYQGSFQRDFALPDSADAEGIVASGSNGVLEISIPKKAEASPRRIQVGVPSVQ